METIELKISLLRKCELFREFSEDEIYDLIPLSNQYTLFRDDFIYKSTMPLTTVNIVTSGRIKVGYGYEEDMEVVAEILKEGDIFGELTMTTDINSNKEVAQVLSETASYLAFKTADFKRMISIRSSTSFNYAKMVAEKLKILSGKYSDIVLQDVRTRIINFFMLHAKYEAKWEGKKAEIKMYCTHQDIAEFTASSRQTVTTIINILVKENKLFYEGRNKLVIPDITMLTRS